MPQSIELPQSSTIVPHLSGKHVASPQAGELLEPVAPDPLPEPALEALVPWVPPALVPLPELVLPVCDPEVTPLEAPVPDPGRLPDSTEQPTTMASSAADETVVALNIRSTSCWRPGYTTDGAVPATWVMCIASTRAQLTDSRAHSECEEPCCRYRATECHPLVQAAGPGRARKFNARCLGDYRNAHAPSPTHL